MAKTTTTTNNTTTITMSPEKATKNTFKFAENLESEFSAPVIGTLYVQKAALGAIGYAEGKQLRVTIEVL